MPLSSQVFAELRTFGGYLHCTVCKHTAPLGDPAARVVGEGWPTCCGSTMRWITARELAQHGDPNPRERQGGWSL